MAKIGRGCPPRVGTSSNSKPLSATPGIKKTGGNGLGGKKGSKMPGKGRLSKNMGGKY